MRLLPALCLTLFATLSHAAEPDEVDWLELLPPEDLAALEAMPQVRAALDRLRAEGRL